MLQKDRCIYHKLTFPCFIKLLRNELFNYGLLGSGKKEITCNKEKSSSMFQRMENGFVCILSSKLPMNTNLSIIASIQCWNFRLWLNPPCSKTNVLIHRFENHVVKERIRDKDWGIGKKKSLKGENLTREKMVIMMLMMSITQEMRILSKFKVER
jgi:hypothetical protein